MVKVVVLKPRFNATQSVYLAELQRQAGSLWNAMLDQFWYEWREEKVWNNYGKAGGSYEKILPLVEKYAPLLPRKCAIALSCDFADAFAAIRELKKKGDGDVRYPHKKRRYRPVSWSAQALSVRGGTVSLGKARGVDAPDVAVAIPENLAHLPLGAFKQVTMKWAGGRYEVHLAYDDGVVPAPARQTGKVIAVDFGLKRFWVVTDGERAWGFKSGALFSIIRGREKHKRHVVSHIDRARRGSNHRRDLKREKNRRSGQSEDRQRNYLHQSSRSLIDVALEADADTIVLGDVKGLQGSKRMRRQQQQQLSPWPRFKWEQYLEYKAKEVGIKIVRISEAYTSKTCPLCGQQNIPNGREYTCADCGWVGDRDLVGACNILSRYLYGELAKIAPPEGQIMYRQVDAWKGVKSRRVADDDLVPVTEPCGTVGHEPSFLRETGALSGETQLPLADLGLAGGNVQNSPTSALAEADLNHPDLPLPLGGLG